MKARQLTARGAGPPFAGRLGGEGSASSIVDVCEDGQVDLVPISPRSARCTYRCHRKVVGEENSAMSRRAPKDDDAKHLGED